MPLMVPPATSTMSAAAAAARSGMISRGFSQTMCLPAFAAISQTSP